MDKLLAKFLNSPRSLKFSQIESILLRLGFQKTQTKGSHLKFDHLVLKKPVIVPIHHNDCKKGYKYKIAKIIKKLLAQP